MKSSTAITTILGFFKLSLARCLVVRSLTLLVLLLCLSSASQAQGRDATYAINVNWSGFYIGGHVGYAATGHDSVFDSSSIDRPYDFEDATLGRDFDLDHALAGLNIGWNSQIGSFVWGVEADVSYLGASDRAFDPEAEGPRGTTTDNATADVNWLASLRGRFGVVSARTLFFATAGIAWVDAKYTAQNLDNISSDQGSVSLSGPGFVVGGGIEHAVSDRFSIKLEGLYYSFNRSKDTNGLTTDSGPNDFAKLEDIIVARLGVSYSLAPRSNEVTASRDPSISALWQGFYAGGHAGYSLVSFNSIFDADEIINPFANELSVLGRFFDLDGGVFGAHLGYNIVIGRYIVGVEADWSRLSASDTRFDPIGASVDDDSASADIDWIASLRARFGLTSARSLFYATAGVAWVGGDYTMLDGDCLCGPTIASISLNQTGFVVGGGIEHAITDQVLLRFEALHYVFGKRFDTRGLTPASSVGDFAKLKDISVARFGVSYKFNSN